MANDSITIHDMVTLITNRSNAKKINKDAVLPFVVVPLLLLAATISIFTTLFVMVMIVMAVLYVCSRPQQKNRSIFFHYWTISSFITIALIHSIEVVGSNVTTLYENLLVLALAAGSLYCFYEMKQVADFELALGSSKGKEYSPMLTSDSKYCQVCQIEVNERYFHSIWWNCCVFRPNYRYYLAGNVLGVCALTAVILMGTSLACMNISFEDILLPRPASCLLAYANFNLSLVLVSCIYASGFAAAGGGVLLRELCARARCGGAAPAAARAARVL